MPIRTMREHMLAVVRGHEVDRVPFVVYDGVAPLDEVLRVVGPGRVGLMRWCSTHRLEYPHCRFVTETFFKGGAKWQRTTLYTPEGSLYEERAFEPVYDSSSIRKHYVESRRDYEILWCYLRDCVVRDNYDEYQRVAAELGDNGFPLANVERTPYQQLWVQWVGLDQLPYHWADYGDYVEQTMALLTAQARQTFEIAYRSPSPFIDFPDNITAPAIGPRRFREYAVPLYNELAGMLAERGGIVYVHMDGDLKPLWGEIGRSRVRGLDSFSPRPDNDTSVAEAAAMWPEMRLWVNFPSSVHLRPADEVRAEAEAILAAAGHSGRLQIQISENVPLTVWRQTLPVIAAACEAFRP